MSTPLATPSPLRRAWAVVAGVLALVPQLPFNGKGIQEKADGSMALNQDGVWIFAFEENYDWPKHSFDDKPHSSRAEVVLGIQAGRAWLNGIVDDAPQQAIMDMTYALRQALQAASAAETFLNASPSFRCRLSSTAQVFAEAINFGVVQATIEIKGFES